VAHERRAGRFTNPKMDGGAVDHAALLAPRSKLYLNNLHVVLRFDASGRSNGAIPTLPPTTRGNRFRRKVRLLL